MEIPPTHYPATRAASLVASYINHQHGGPHRVYSAGSVAQASREDIEEASGAKKHKYKLTFSLLDGLKNGNISVANCTAEIIYHLNPQGAPEINYKLDKELQKDTQDADKAWYTKMRNLKMPLEAGKIPDDLGNMSPEMEPVRHLAQVACGYIVWQNATEETKYNMIQVQSVQQVKRDDESLEFNYFVFFHDMVSQEIILWKLQVLWHPEHGVEVKENSRQPRYGSA
ncbi:latexin [Ambystoma mexicanum]|uniref:latexin n=1 Tax=Ambystoma mexicanum TaxID=8296 RepID=UPI0037E81A11